MSNKKQTAVEYLVDEINKYLAWNVEGEPKAEPYTDGDLVRAMEQAKEIEKQQIIEAAADHSYPTCAIARVEAELYYKNTYDIHTEESED